MTFGGTDSRIHATTGDVHECRIDAALPRRGLASVIAWALVCAVAAAVFYAIAAALQQHEAAQSAASSGMSLLARLVRRPRWLAGVAATVVGAALHVVSLRLGPLALVQPVGVTGLLFALPLGAALHGHRLLRCDLGAAAVVILGLVGLLASVQVHAGTPSISERASGVLAAATGVLAWSATLVGRRLPAAPRGAVLAVAGGAAFGAASALVRVVARQVGVVGPLHAIVGWTPVALIAVAFLGLSLSQSAYQVGTLAAVLPALSVVDPVVAAVVGELLLGEPVTFTAIGAAGTVVSSLVILAASVQLARAQGREGRGI